METNFQEIVNDMNEMVVNGKLLNAAHKYYAPNIKTIEFDGSVTEGRQAAIKKLTDFVGSIRQVNEITLVRSAYQNNASFSEFIIDLDMTDGSNMYLHEIIRSLWANEYVVEERYFKG